MPDLEELLVMIRALPANDRDALARVVFAEPPAPRARVAFRPIVISEPARPSSLGTGVCNEADAARATPAPVVSVVTEQQIAGVLADAQRFGETIEAMYRRKERALCDVFAQLAPIEAHALFRRLANPAAGDLLAAQFGRLVSDRRARLLAFLAGARRRDALRSA
jgi:hypothetical protein